MDNQGIIQNGAIPSISIGEAVTMNSSSISSLVSTRRVEESETFGTREIPPIPNNTNHSHIIRESMAPLHDQRNNINQENTIIAPQDRRGAFYLGSFLNYQQNIVLEWIPQLINLLQQEYTPTITYPHAQIENQVGSNDELVREFMQIQIENSIEIDMERIRIGQLLRIQLQSEHTQNEQGLNEDGIFKHIRCENFEVTTEATSAKNEELCCICQDAYINGEQIGKLDCAHTFHMDCIKEWLLEKNICPLCKRRGLFVVDEVIDGF